MCWDLDLSQCVFLSNIRGRWRKLRITPILYQLITMHSLWQSPIRKHGRKIVLLLGGNP